ncbi:MAG: DUF2996 domain-containing protein [Pseudanabaenaceae cyanobacterium]
MSDTPETPVKAPKAKQATVEDLPLVEFIPNHYLPALRNALEKKGVTDLNLSFSDRKVEGKWAEGQRSFAVYFSKDNIHALKGFSCASFGRQPSIIEPFLVDERKATLDLLVFGVVQRLNAQKWLQPN